MNKYTCHMPADMMPECCAQHRNDGSCINSGGDCKYRKATQQPFDTEATPVTDEATKAYGGLQRVSADDSRRMERALRRLARHYCEMQGVPGEEECWVKWAMTADSAGKGEG